MSAVTKCDICGAIYRANEVPSKTCDIGVTEYEAHTGDYNYFGIDCCPECTKRLGEFIDVLREGHPYIIYVNKPLSNGIENWCFKCEGNK